jgi:hypothetical protein
MTRPASEADSSIEDNEFLLGPGLLLPAVQGCERHRGAPARGHDGGYEHFSVWVAVAFRAWPSRACACRGLCSLHVSVRRTAAAGCSPPGARSVRLYHTNCRRHIFSGLSLRRRILLCRLYRCAWVRRCQLTEIQRCVGGDLRSQCCVDRLHRFESRGRVGGGFRDIAAALLQGRGLVAGQVVSHHDILGGERSGDEARRRGDGRALGHGVVGRALDGRGQASAQMRQWPALKPRVPRLGSGSFS